MNMWTDEEDLYVKEHYYDDTYQEIADYLGRTKSAVQSRCYKLGLMKKHSSKKKKLNSNFFETIDTEAKAYWLGFICADGCVSYNKNTMSYMFKITLQRRDSDFLKCFIKAIDGDFDIKLKTAKISGIEKIYETCEVAFNDKKFTSDLLKYFSTNKTEYLRIPKQVPEDLVRHFIRGFSDGDGCFYCNIGKRDKSFEIVGKCYDMLRDIQCKLEDAGIVSRIYKQRETKYKLFVGSFKYLKALVSYLYDGATIFLERKRLKSQEILQLAS